MGNQVQKHLQGARNRQVAASVGESLLSVAICYFSSPIMSICDHLRLIGLVSRSSFLVTLAL